MNDAREWSDEEAALVDRLHAGRPRAGHGLRQRVRFVMHRAARERQLRRQALAMVASGTVLLAVAAWLAVTAPA